MRAPGHRHGNLKPGRRPWGQAARRHACCIAGTAALLLAGCGNDEPAEAARGASPVDGGAPDGAGRAEDAADAQGDAQVDAGASAPATTVHAATCGAPDLPQPWTPPGCAHAVTHPNAVAEAQWSCGPATAAPRLLRTTFPSTDPARNLAVQWMGEAGDRSARVRFGESPDRLDREVVGHTFTLQAFGGRRMHEVHLCGLEPGRTYHYQAGGEGADGTAFWSPVATLTTLPARDTEDEFTLALAGDTRSMVFNTAWAEALQTISARGVDALLFSGDAVEVGLVQAQWDEWFLAGEGIFGSLPVIPTNGNHDLLTANYLTAFALPEGEENFHYRFGNALIISMNDLPLGDPGRIRGATRDYLDATLRAHADATWKIVLHHRAIYSASNHGTTESLHTHWRPVYDAHGVDLVVNGHDHNYERTHPIRDGAVVAPGQGTLYTVVAGIGAPLYGNGNEWWTAVSEKVSSYAILRVEGRRAEFTAYRLDGTVLDQVVLEK